MSKSQDVVSKKPDLVMQGCHFLVGVALINESDRIDKLTCD